MIIVFLISSLLISFLIHLYYLTQYALKRIQKYYKGFIVTLASNILSAGFLIFFTLKKPELIQGINMGILLWILSGVFMFMVLFLKISIFKNIYKRSQDPEHYHLNFFGKKVLHGTAVKPVEVVAFFGSIPFFLASGAYFVARLLNLYLYNHL